MKKVIINAYACCPRVGSEPGMGWNWCVSLAKHCELFIITESEFRSTHEQIVPTLEQGRNMHFYYNPVPQRVRDMCWNQGDWRFYYFLRKWQRKTYEIAMDICSREKIDILHQLNMVGYREPGYLWKLSQELNIPFVWGPIGGLKQFPLAYTRGADVKMKLFFRLKNLINTWQIKYDRRVDAALRQASILVSTTPDSYKALKRYKNLDSVIIPETGCPSNIKTLPRNTISEELHILWVGKLDFRKQLPIAIRTIAETRNPHVKLEIFGTDRGRYDEKARALIRELHLEQQVTLKMSSSYEEIMKAGLRSDLFLFTSVSEETSTVVPEALACQMPVVCFDCCGMGHVVTDEVGIKVPLSSPDQSVKDFAAVINHLFDHRDELHALRDNCLARAQELSWDSKAAHMVRLYQDAALV